MAGRDGPAVGAGAGAAGGALAAAFLACGAAAALAAATAGLAAVGVGWAGGAADLAGGAAGGVGPLQAPPQAPPAELDSMGQISQVVSDLRVQADLMNAELRSQSATLDGISDAADRNASQMQRNAQRTRALR